MKSSLIRVLHLRSLIGVKRKRHFTEQ